jgi:uncharacterized protein (TIGR02453 family)
MMQYFKDSFHTFFKDLAANNNRDWYHANKSRYESEVKKPFENFIKDLIVEISKEDSLIAGTEAKDCIFRIFRDTRFSADKTPYKLYASAIISPNGRKDMDYPGTYIQMGVGELWIGGGAYMPTKEQLEKIRVKIIQSEGEVNSLIADQNFIKYFGAIRGDKNKRLLKPFADWTEKIPLVANKQFYYMAEYHDNEQLITQEDFMEFVMQHYRASKNWLDFLKNAIK